MLSRTQRMLNRLHDSLSWRELTSTMSSGIAQAKERLDALVIRERRFKKHDVLFAMHQAILETPALRCNPEASVELHTLTAHHHLKMYLTALKSLLRYPVDVAVVVHDDGSLDDRDKSQLSEHVSGIRIVSRATADTRLDELLAHYPHCRRLRSRIVNSLELFDNILLSNTKRILNMNSDVLFFREPSELIAWIREDDSTLAGVYERRPAEQQKFLRTFDCSFPPHVTTALTCFYKDVYDLEFIENALSKIKPDWFTAQNVYPLLFDHSRTRYRARFFDEQRYQASGVFPNDPIFRHYWTSTGMFTELQYRDSARVIRDLSSVPA